MAWIHFYAYSSNRAFGKTLISARSSKDYYASKTHEWERNFAKVVLNVIEEGVNQGEIRDDIPLKTIRQVFLGGIETISFNAINFNRELSPDQSTDDLCEILFNSIRKSK